MNKCFITKLPSSVDNDNLPVLGQLRFNWLKQNRLTDSNARAIDLATNDSITVKVSGAHFTDRTFTNNLGNTKTITSADDTVGLFISNDADAVLTIDNKYSLTVLDFKRDDLDGLDGLEKPFDIKDIKYCTNLSSIDLRGSYINGDISAIKNLINLSHLSIDYGYPQGDKTYVNGDISALSNLTKLNFISIYANVNGDVSSLANLTNLTILSFKGSSVIGDISKLPTQLPFMSVAGRVVDTNFTWTANGRRNATLLAIDGGAPFDTTSMDNMLIDQATCTSKGNDKEPWTKTISVSGTRTSASDAAVETLQSMGITITGVTKQA